jgi:hypothetical protein
MIFVFLTVGKAYPILVADLLALDVALDGSGLHRKRVGLACELTSSGPAPLRTSPMLPRTSLVPPAAFHAHPMCNT